MADDPIKQMRGYLAEPPGQGVSDAGLFHLTYRLKLDAPALLASRAGDPNTVEGDRFIPGSSLLGAFAGQWIARTVAQGKYVEFGTSGHMPFLEEAAKFNDALGSFLARAS